MSDGSLRERLRQSEDNFIERKPDGVNARDIRRTLVAFANSVPQDRDAVLYIGVADDGKPVGVQNPDALQKAIREICDKQCYPPITIRSEVLTVEDKSVIAVIVPSSKTKPHFAGPAYVRVGSESVEASEAVYNELITERLAKCRLMLQAKRRKEIVTVIARGKKLGSSQYLGDARYRDTHECRIEACEPHFVRLFDINRRQYFSEPMENVTVAWDEARNRLALDIREP